jgi:hypothetical protein
MIYLNLTTLWPLLIYLEGSYKAILPTQQLPHLLLLLLLLLPPLLINQIFKYGFKITQSFLQPQTQMIQFQKHGDLFI